MTGFASPAWGGPRSSRSTRCGQADGAWSGSICFLDPGTFIEMDRFVFHRAANPGAST